MLKKIIIFLFILVFSCNVFAVGTNSASFLKIKFDARTIAMGGVSASLSEGSGSLETNPSGLIDVLYNDQQELTLAHNKWFQNINGDYISYARPIAYNSVLGVYAKYIYMNDLVRRDILGNDLGNFGASYGLFGISYLQELLEDELALGITLKGLQEKIDDNSNTTYAFDIGTLYMMEFCDIGFSIQNIGQGVKLYDERFSLPLTFTLGIRKPVAENIDLGFDIEQEKNNDTVFKIGGEYKLLDYFSLRTGYKYTKQESADSGITAGFGINYNAFELNYAYVPFGDLGDTHRISLTVRWGSASSESYKEINNEE
jgi:hypothetical protein